MTSEDIIYHAQDTYNQQETVLPVHAHVSWCITQQPPDLLGDLSEERCRVHQLHTAHWTNCWIEVSLSTGGR